MSRVPLLLFMLSILIPISVHAFSKEWVTVDSVVDGDTVLITIDGVQHDFNLVDIDAPELRQEFGPESKQCLENIVLGKKVLITESAILRGGQHMCGLAADNRNVSMSMVWDGCAWTDKSVTQFTNDALYFAMQNAKENKRGLWSHNSPTRPDVFLADMKQRQKNERDLQKKLEAYEAKKAASKALDDSESIVFTDNEVVASQFSGDHKVVQIESTPRSSSHEENNNEEQEYSLARKARPEVVYQCEKEWPGDYRMIEYCIERQGQAYDWLLSHNVPFSIKSKCMKHWGKDYRMAKYCCERQMKSKKKVYGK